MKALARLLAAACAVLCMAAASDPSERLADPAQEARARELFKEVRCLVCQNESIDDSNADLAKDLRLLVRARLAAGDTDTEVIDYLVSRYGEFVLLKPRFSTRTLILWGAPVAILLIGAGVMVMNSRGRSQRVAAAAGGLSEAEKAELAKLLKDRDRQA